MLCTTACYVVLIYNSSLCCNSLLNHTNDKLNNQEELICFSLLQAPLAKPTYQCSGIDQKQSIFPLNCRGIRFNDKTDNQESILLKKAGMYSFQMA